MNRLLGAAMVPRGPRPGLVAWTAAAAAAARPHARGAVAWWPAARGFTGTAQTAPVTLLTTPTMLRLRGFATLPASLHASMPRSPSSSPPPTTRQRITAPTVDTVLYVNANKRSLYAMVFACLSLSVMFVSVSEHTALNMVEDSGRTDARGETIFQPASFAMRASATVACLGTAALLLWCCHVYTRSRVQTLVYRARGRQVEITTNALLGPKQHAFHLQDVRLLTPAAAAALPSLGGHLERPLTVKTRAHALGFVLEREGEMADPALMDFLLYRPGQTPF
ncbi:hypothetical protein CXG81DRAFT_24886 [Caulochytrium protostelioides]|uniref:Transmembrane protein 223 n=1 Tax=Caulochytrium protostelioides TaxID=1555241 RepID=A0A4P9XAX8_9FUNG|nr:hypothetical protein CXG81DRAFT_24886 [Caulochytrium protostelioides]|eukprot:RKP02512.1 hypothetical protein CXG81DRAFT_24886 [Caulochytrium protostelioides]